MFQSQSATNETSDAEKGATASLLASYKRSTSGFDELLDEDGALRPHYSKLTGAFEQLGFNELTMRRDTASRILREHGVTYNIYGDTQGQGRPWALDLVPLVIPPDEWREVEAGLAQRARLLNLILADIYGPQQLFKEGVLPAALLQANPAFLRPCHGIVPPKNIFLFLQAVDLARSPDGQWWVLSDRTQAPSGAGYALENRIVLSRVLPDEFRECHVERLASFFQIMRDTLRSLATRAAGQPNVVLLTPGPHNETYFEHVYLARYLGFQLVEGADLTVRDRRVFLKTLEGLQPVDVILRRTDDAFCDPLELRADSFLGVPGLVEAARAGNVAVANALGSGAVETPALAAFLPGLARRLLGEELRLPSVATWWCGQEKEFEHVRKRLKELVLKRAFSRGDKEPVFGGILNEQGRASLLAELEAAPFDFVAQEQVALSTSPVLERGKLEPRPIVFRTYICATSDGFAVMPGGLTRFSTSPDRLVVSMQSGGGSKDTWVIADGPVNQFSLLQPTTQIIRLERAAAEVPSRVADNLFWLGRYAERLEDTVRLLRCVLVRLAGEMGSDETPDLTALVRLLANLDLFPAKFRERHTLAGVEREVYMLIYQPHRLGAVREVQSRLSQIAFALRDRFSSDTWRILNKLQMDARPRPGRVPISEVLALLNTLIVDLAAFAGMEMENMTRGHSWRFLDIGRRLERASNIATLVQGALKAEPSGVSALEPVLEIADSVMTYRRRYFAQPLWPPVLDLLLADESNPRSLAFQVNALADHAANLPREGGRGRGRETRQIDALRGLIDGADFPALAEAQFSGRDEGLNVLLARIAAELRGISDSLNHQYFSHAAAQVS
jgi:uncharacterized circularly permuted ATP-grasp superfamily protein/uncharacterized alpha-E superfamily protein